MNLAGLFQYGNKNTAGQKTEIVRPQGNAGNDSTGNQSSQAVKNLTTGQSVHGEVIAKNGSEVQIRVDQDVVITARIDRDIPVSVGQSMTFEVQNSSGAKITLRPLYENLAQDANVLKALEAAKLPNTDEMMRMVSAMMKQGMSIDKNALLSMSKSVFANTGANPETIVALKNMQLPITPENIGQFENYQRYEHQIMSNVTDILMEIPQVYQSMVNSGQGGMAVDFYTQLLGMLTGTQAASGEGTGLPSGGNVFADIVGAGENGNAPIQESGTVTPESAEALQNAHAQAKAQMADSLLALGGDGVEEATLFKAQNGASLEEGVVPSGTAINETIDGNQQLSGMMELAGRERLAMLLGRLGATEEQLMQIQNGSITAKELLKDIQLLLSSGGEELNRADVMKLFGSKEYGDLLGKELMNQWLMKPEQVAKKGDIEDFYNKLREQTARLTESLGEAAKNTPLAKSLNNIQSNMDFMNQLNQMFHYIQLPLKMSGGNAHGDLYVYTNRKSTIKEDGSVSALLHLDMEHLGTMDIHVLMQNQKVSTKFYLADESMIDFIAEHIHILDERMEKRGYAFHAEMLKSEEIQGSAGVIQNVMAEERKEALISQYSFDVRA